VPLEQTINKIINKNYCVCLRATRRYAGPQILIYGDLAGMWEHVGVEFDCGLHYYVSQSKQKQNHKQTNKYTQILI
jgi:hypothetical protein